MLPILIISNYLGREQLAKENQSKGKIRNASSILKLRGISGSPAPGVYPAF